MEKGTKNNAAMSPSETQRTEYTSRECRLENDSQKLLHCFSLRLHTPSHKLQCFLQLKHLPSNFYI